MKSEKVKEFIHFFMEDSNRAVAFLSSDGELVQVNNLFREVFQMENMHNIKELLDETSIAMWNEFTKIAKTTDFITFYMPIQMASNNFSIFEIRLMYYGADNHIIALFNRPFLSEKKVETSYSNAFYKSDDIMFLTDQNKIIFDVNELFSTIFNVDRESFIGKPMKELFYLCPSSYAEYEKYMKSAFINGSAEFFHCCEHSNRDVRHYYITILYNKETLMYLMRVLDRTEQVHLEEQLARQDKMSSIGQLAASIAHEIRNPMTALKGFTQLLRVSATEESKRYLTVIDDEIVRMEAILNEMLILSKPGANEKEIISLQKLVASIIQVVHPKANLDGIIIIEKINMLADDSIFGDEGKLKQVLLNLIKNALEAMPLGGVLTTDIEQSSTGELILSIADTGKGIDAKQLKQIFNPYFTTRSEGTGLGLPFVLKTVEEQGGAVLVESEVNVGTKFMLSFPPAISNMYSEIVDERVLTDLGWHY